MAPNHASMLVRVAAKRWEGYVQAGLLSREIREFGVPTRWIFVLVTWNLTVEQRSSLHGGNDHELRRWVGHRQGSAGEMAGPGTARTSGRMVAGVDRSRASAPDDRRVCPRSGRIPAHVRPIRRRSDHREPGTHCRLRT